MSTVTGEMTAAPREPHGELSIRVLAMPADTNGNGDVFGGWLFSQMDIAGSVFTYKVAKGRTVTVAADAMTFRKPVYVGDVISIYADLVRVGRTSITIRVEAWIMRRNEATPLLVTDGNFTYVAIDDQNRPRPVTQGTDTYPTEATR